VSSPTRRASDRRHRHRRERGHRRHHERGHLHRHHDRRHRERSAPIIIASSMIISIHRDEHHHLEWPIIWPHTIIDTIIGAQFGTPNSVCHCMGKTLPKGGVGAKRVHVVTSRCRTAGRGTESSVVRVGRMVLCMCVRGCSARKPVVRVRGVRGCTPACATVCARALPPRRHARCCLVRLVMVVVSNVRGRRHSEGRRRGVVKGRLARRRKRALDARSHSAVSVCFGGHRVSCVREHVQGVVSGFERGEQREESRLPVAGRPVYLVT